MRLSSIAVRFNFSLSIVFLLTLLIKWAPQSTSFLQDGHSMQSAALRKSSLLPISSVLGRFELVSVRYTADPRTYVGDNFPQHVIHGLSCAFPTTMIDR